MRKSKEDENTQMRLNTEENRGRCRVLVFDIRSGITVFTRAVNAFAGHYGSSSVFGTTTTVRQSPPSSSSGEGTEKSSPTTSWSSDSDDADADFDGGEAEVDDDDQ